MKKQQSWYWITLFLLCLFLSGCGQETPTLQLEEETQEEVKPKEEAPNKQTEEPEQLCVYVCGAVQQPGVYYLKAGARIYEAIEAAGGLTEEAEPTYVNQAAPLEDGSQVVILTKEEVAEGETTEGKNAEGKPSKKININTATLEELKIIPGIGDTKATAILAYRTDHGTFKTNEDLKAVPGIKGKVFEKIEAYITTQ